jgi:hypothetical protein
MVNMTNSNVTGLIVYKKPIGGFLYAITAGAINVANCEFLNIEEAGEGGMLYVTSSPHIHFENSRFKSIVVYNFFFFLFLFLVILF